MHSTRLPRGPVSARRLFALLAFVIGLSWGGAASAQYANRSIGLSVGYLGAARSLGINGGGQLGLDFSVYLDSGFELQFRPWAGVFNEVTEENHFGFGTPIGLRYLFTEDPLRPFVSLSLAPIWFLDSKIFTETIFGVSPGGGIEYYVAEDMAVGLQLEYHRFIRLNDSDGNAYSGTVRVSWGF